MTKFLAFIFFAVCFLGVSAQAQDIAQFAKNMAPASKSELSTSVDELLKKGVINEEQAAQVRQQIKEMNEKDIKDIHKKAQSLFQ